jgi:hypothetical protein
VIITVLVLIRATILQYRSKLLNVVRLEYFINYRVRNSGILKTSSDTIRNSSIYL